MNTKGFIAAIADEMGEGTTQAKVKDFLDAFKEVVGEVCVDNGETINLQGFGKFYRKDVAARLSRNPRTGETVQVEAKQKPMFKFSPIF